MVVCVTKSALREQMRATCAAISETALTQAGLEIAKRIQEHSVWQSAAVVGVYAALPGEIPLQWLIDAAWREGKQVCFPRVVDRAGRRMEFAAVADRAEFITGAYGIAEPSPQVPSVEPQRLAVVLVPGLAFAVTGARLGRGAGFYDRYLAACSAIRIGVALEQQILATVPLEPTDQVMDWLATPAGLTQC